MVRPLPARLTGRREPRRQARREDAGREGQHRREPAAGDALQHLQHPHPDRLPQRPRGGPPGRLHAPGGHGGAAQPVPRRRADVPDLGAPLHCAFMRDESGPAEVGAWRGQAIGRCAGGSAEAAYRGFLFADLRGFTASSSRAASDRRPSSSMPTASLVREQVARHAGAEIRTEGDSFYVVFPSARAAVACGLGITAAAATVLRGLHPDRSDQGRASASMPARRRSTRTASSAPP